MEREPLDRLAGSAHQGVGPGVAVGADGSGRERHLPVGQAVDVGELGARDPQRVAFAPGTGAATGIDSKNTGTTT